MTDLFRFSTPQFIVLLVGISLSVIASVHLPRHAQSRGLEAQLTTLISQGQVLENRLEQAGLERQALENDSFFRREALRKLTGQNMAGEMILSEKLRLQHSQIPTR
ncbi:MAG: hypothetical protein OSB09_06650 [Planctomycetota bacterium]|nr:hypothetical protein [Planctomycetota bacterium]